MGGAARLTRTCAALALALTGDRVTGLDRSGSRRSPMGSWAAMPARPAAGLKPSRCDSLNTATACMICRALAVQTNWSSSTGRSRNAGLNPSVVQSGACDEAQGCGETDHGSGGDARSDSSLQA